MTARGPSLFSESGLGGMLAAMSDGSRNENCEEVSRAPAGPREQSAWMRRMTVLFVWAVVLVLFFIFFNALSTVMLGVLAAAIVAATLSPWMKFIPGPRGVAAGEQTCNPRGL